MAYLRTMSTSIVGSKIKWPTCRRLISSNHKMRSREQNQRKTNDGQRKPYPARFVTKRAIKTDNNSHDHIWDVTNWWHKARLLAVEVKLFLKGWNSGVVEAIYCHSCKEWKMMVISQGTFSTPPTQPKLLNQTLTGLVLTTSLYL